MAGTIKSVKTTGEKKTMKTHNPSYYPFERSNEPFCKSTACLLRNINIRKIYIHVLIKSDKQILIYAVNCICTCEYTLFEG